MRPARTQTREQRLMRTQSPHACKVIRITESKKYVLVESGILGFEIRNPAQGIRNPWSPESSNGIRNPQGGIQNPRLSLITLHGVSELSAKIVFYGKHPAPITRDRWEPETS